MTEQLENRVRQLEDLVRELKEDLARRETAQAEQITTRRLVVIDDSGERIVLQTVPHWDEAQIVVIADQAGQDDQTSARLYARRQPDGFDEDDRRPRQEVGMQLEIRGDDRGAHVQSYGDEPTIADLGVEWV